jgi:hypothetical protein
MRRNPGSLITLSILFFTAASMSLAQTGSKAPGAKPVPGSAAMAPGMPKPAAEMDRVKWMVGTWQCTGKTMTSWMGPEHAIEAEVKSGMILDGMWIVHHYREKKTAQNTMPISTDEVWTYDSAESMWDRLAIDNTGGWATGTAKGWEKGKIVWTSEGMMGGQKMKFRDTFMEKNPREITYMGEIGTRDGKWSTVWDISCKK